MPVRTGLGTKWELGAGDGVRNGGQNKGQSSSRMSRKCPKCVEGSAGGRKPMAQLLLVVIS